MVRLCTNCATRVAPTDQLCGACGLELASDYVSDHYRSVESALPALRVEIELLLAKGKKIDAVILYRGVTQVGLHEAKEAVDAYEVELVNRGIDIPRRKAQPI